MNRNLKLIAYLLFAIGLPLWLFYLTRDEGKEKASAYKLEIDSATLNKVLTHFDKNNPVDGETVAPDSVSQKLSQLQTLVEDNRRSLDGELETINNQLQTLDERLADIPAIDGRPGFVAAGRLLWVYDSISKRFNEPIPKDSVLSYKRLRVFPIEVDTSASFIKAGQYLSVTSGGRNRYQCVVVEMNAMRFANDTAMFLRQVREQNITLIVFNPHNMSAPYFLDEYDYKEYIVTTPSRVYELLQLLAKR